MFGLLYNLYKYLKEKSERTITLVLLGIDNAGKTTMFNTLNGEFGVETSPTYGFDSSCFIEGKYKVRLFDLGGGRNIRKIWKVYLPEVHGVMYVVDSADPKRFEEAKQILEQTLQEPLLNDKPIVIFANKQDLPTAASPATVAQALGLASLHKNTFNIVGCTAKTPEGQEPDLRVKDGMKWVISTIDNVFTKLDLRVQREAEIARQEELRKKKEREEIARKAREERLRLEKEQEQLEQAKTQAEEQTENLLRDGTPSAQATVTIPNYVDSTTPKGEKPALLLPDFTDLNKPKVKADGDDLYYTNAAFETDVRKSPHLDNNAAAVDSAPSSPGMEAAPGKLADDRE